MSIFARLRETYADTESRVTGSASARPRELLEIRSNLRKACFHLDHAAECLDSAGIALDRAWSNHETTDTDERARAVLAEIQETADEIRLRLNAMIDH